jgi:hypothetical protein
VASPETEDALVATDAILAAIDDLKEQMGELRRLIAERKGDE